MTPEFYKIFSDYQEIAVRYDEPHKAVWCYFNPVPKPCFSITMLRELRELQQRIIDYYGHYPIHIDAPVQYVIICSQIPGIFNLGGDLTLFARLIKERNKEQLLEYATLCIEIVYLNAVSMHLPITVVALVEGTALGGGFESALSANILIATEDAEMGFPEIRFNLFPGMGAYSLLARLVGTVTAEKMIDSGIVYHAGELYQKGIVNHMIGSNNVDNSVDKILQQHNLRANGLRAILKVRQRYHPITYHELEDIVKIWVDTAMRMKDKDLRMMDRLVNAQQLMMNRQGKKFLLRTKQDRRFTKDCVVFPLKDSSGNIIMTDRRKDSDRRQQRS